MGVLFLRTLGITLIVGTALACAKPARERYSDDDDDGGGLAGGGGFGGSAACGNGRIDVDLGESCDGDDLGDMSCAALGFSAGELLCDPLECVIDASGCGDPDCGNGQQEPGEECDGADLAGEDCQSLGFAGGTLSCDASCMYVGCGDGFSEDFEAGVLGAHWSSSGGTWSLTTLSPHAGTYCASSPDIGDLGTTALSTQVTLAAAGAVTFWHRESSESSYDSLSFYVDGQLQGQWSGENAWAMSSTPLGPGTHLLEWRYSKDGSVSAGADAVYVDDVVIVE